MKLTVTIMHPLNLKFLSSAGRLHAHLCAPFAKRLYQYMLKLLLLYATFCHLLACNLVCDSQTAHFQFHDFFFVPYLTRDQFGVSDGPAVARVW